MNSLSRRISEAVNAATGPGPIEAVVGPDRVTVQLTSVGPVGLAFDMLGFVAADRAEWSAGALKAWGDRLVDRLTYLMEPLVVLEVDSQGGVVELRSRMPTARGEVQSYYELLLRRDGSLSLTRVAFDSKDRRRRPVSCQLTTEALERLTDDLVSSVGGDRS